MTRLLPYVQQIEGSQTPRMSESNSVIQMLQMKYGNTDQDVTSQEPAQVQSEWNVLSRDGVEIGDVYALCKTMRSVVKHVLYTC